MLLATGQAVPISQLKPGDKVLATSTKTGKTQPETISAVMVHRDTDLYNLTVEVGSKTAVIDTTANHPFWDATTLRWVEAAQLRPGDRLRSPGGTVVIVAGYTPRERAGWVWDLTIQDSHDFYVSTPAGPVLVHNDNGSYIPPPQGNLPGFPTYQRVRSKGGRACWADPKSGRILEWDGQHGKVEMFDKTGKNHLGEYDPSTGAQTKPPVPGRNCQP